MLDSMIVAGICFRYRGGLAPDECRLDRRQPRAAHIRWVATLGAMATLFTMIINGEIPGRFVWRDERVVAFLTIAPLNPGHVLVVTLDEVEHWIDLDPDLLAHLMSVTQTVGRAVDRAFAPSKVGVMIAGLEVPTCTSTWCQ